LYESEELSDKPGTLPLGRVGLIQTDEIAFAIPHPRPVKHLQVVLKNGASLRVSTTLEELKATNAIKG
jgi:hypothetical protein